jgi:ribonuclease-3
MAAHPAADPSPAGLAEVLGVDLDLAALTHALTHRSYAYEHGGLPTNERLEFLGDAVLGLVITDALFLAHPDLPEGQLAKLRASVVNMHALADVARGLGLGAHLRLGRGEETTGGRDKPSILADALEAVLGAVYCERGLAAAAALVRRLFDPVMHDARTIGAGLDWKTSLQELASSTGRGTPVYRVEESGPDHAKRFTATVLLAAVQGSGIEGIEGSGIEGSGIEGTGQGGTKKQAEQRAAQSAYARLLPLPSPPGPRTG